MLKYIQDELVSIFMYGWVLFERKIYHSSNVSQNPTNSLMKNDRSKKRHEKIRVVVVVFSIHRMQAFSGLKIINPSQDFGQMCIIAREAKRRIN